VSHREDTISKPPSAPTLGRRALAALFPACLLLAAFYAAPVGAATTHSPIGSFGSDGTSASRFPLLGSATIGGNSRLAFDQANGRLAVMWMGATSGTGSSGKVCWFDGAPAEPWAPGSCVDGFYFGNSLHNANVGIAVDNSTGPSAGNLYATDVGTGPSGVPPRTHGFPSS
jgi:hypothetical protein